MASKPSVPPKPIAEIEQGPSKFEQFLDRNQRTLVVVAVILVIGVLAYVALRTIQRDNELTAGAALSQASDLTGLLDVVKNHPGSPAAGSASILVADAQWQDGRQDDAISTLRAFLSDYPDHPGRATATAGLGSRLMAQGKNDEARQQFDRLLDDPDARFLAPFALISLGDIARAEGRLDEAEEHYTRARDQFPDNEFSSVASRHLLLLRAKDPVEIDPPPAPEPEPEPTPGSGDSGTLSFPGITGGAAIPPGTPAPEETPDAADEAPAPPAPAEAPEPDTGDAGPDATPAPPESTEAPETDAGTGGESAAPEGDGNAPAPAGEGRN